MSNQSWFGRSLASAKEALSISSSRNVREGTSGAPAPGAVRGGFLNSVACVANDGVKRVGNAFRERVTGRGGFEDAVARVERAAKECSPCERGAMLRAWLAALHALDAADAEADPSEDAKEKDVFEKADAKKNEKADEESAARAETPKDLPGPPDDAASSSKEQTTTTTSPGVDVETPPPLDVSSTSQTEVPEVPPSPNVSESKSDEHEWSTVSFPPEEQKAYREARYASEDRATVSLDIGLTDPGDFFGDAATKTPPLEFKLASDESGNGDHHHQPPRDFRDVLLKSKCLENLVMSFTETPATPETMRLFHELLTELVLPAGCNDVETRDGGFPGDAPEETRLVAARNSSKEGDDSFFSLSTTKVRSDDTETHSSLSPGSARVAHAICQSISDTGSCLRDKHRQTPAGIQLGNETLRDMLSVCAGSVKRFGVVETLAKKQAGVEKSLFLNQTKVHGMGCGATRAAFSDGPSQGKETTSDGSASTANPGPCSTKQEQDTLTVTTPASSVYAQTVTTPSSALAEATKESVALARRAHDFAAAKYLRLGQESQKRPTEGLLTRCRLAGETLTKATLELQSLSTESERALVSADAAREARVAALTFTETKKKEKADVLVTKKRAAEAALSLLSADTFAAEKDAADATQAKVAFEQSSATVRTALTQKVKDLANRQHEYANELRAIEIVASALCGVARLRAGAVERCLRETSESLGRARAMYADAAKAHCNGQLSAARLCVARLRFCANELGETRLKRKEAERLGLITGVDSASCSNARDDASASSQTPPHAVHTVHTSLLDKSSAMEHAYLSAENGATCVFVAAASSLKEARAICPAACEKVDDPLSSSVSRPDPPLPGDSPGALATVFAAIDDARVAFQSLTRPALEIEKETLAGEIEPEQEEDAREGTGAAPSRRDAVEAVGPVWILGLDEALNAVGNDFTFQAICEIPPTYSEITIGNDGDDDPVVAAAAARCEHAETPSVAAPKATVETEDDCAVDETGVEPLDIEIVTKQTGVSRGEAVHALKHSDGDIAAAIVGLTRKS